MSLRNLNTRNLSGLRRTVRFRRCFIPSAKKFIEVGDKVKKGQTIIIVEAMKTMNHVPSTTDGVVKKVLVEDGQPVEFGQTLIILK